MSLHLVTASCRLRSPFALTSPPSLAPCRSSASFPCPCLMHESCDVRGDHPLRVSRPSSWSPAYVFNAGPPCPHGTCVSPDSNWHAASDHVDDFPLNQRVPLGGHTPAPKPTSSSFAVTVNPSGYKIRNADDPLSGACHVLWGPTGAPWGRAEGCTM